MNKRQLVAAAARKSSLTQRQTREALEAILETMVNALAGGDHVLLSGFGRFEVQRYAGRRLRRFDGEGHYTVEDRPVPVFKSSSALRRRLREED
jgi:integration host factor subunit beta